MTTATAVADLHVLHQHRNDPDGPTEFFLATMVAGAALAPAAEPFAWRDFSWWPLADYDQDPEECTGCDGQHILQTVDITGQIFDLCHCVDPKVAA